jgi:isocitrate lyase
MNASMFQLAVDYKNTGMSGYTKLQNEEFKLQSLGYTAVKHQRESSVGYFDMVRQIIDGNNDSNSALIHSTEKEQF